jgi:MFS-type transporter involved in bile tolerance (Atg22 family)
MLIIALSLGFSSFPTLSINYFFKDVLKLDPTELSLFNSVINFVWILKPIFGFICDSYPLFGSRRRSYLILFSLVGALGWILLGTWVTNLWQAILVKTLINISINFCNVIGEAIMVENSQIASIPKKDQSSDSSDEVKSDS